jgi:hypothetical protein
MDITRLKEKLMLDYTSPDVLDLGQSHLLVSTEVKSSRPKFEFQAYSGIFKRGTEESMNSRSRKLIML